MNKVFIIKEYVLAFVVVDAILVSTLFIYYLVDMVYLLPDLGVH
jgi:hypothetical protein